MSTTNTVTTLYQPTGFSPSNTAIDMSQDQPFICQINGTQVDSYELTVLDDNNNILYDTGTDTIVANSNSSITYNGTWTTNNNQMIDDNNSAIQYYGYGWTSYSDPTVGFYGGSIHHSNTANDYAQYTFVGTGINFYGTKGADKGVVGIYIDGESEGTVDCYIANGTGANQNNFQQLIYSVTNLSLGSHTIKLVVTGNKNGASTNSLIDIDYFQVLNSDGSKNSNITGNNIQYTFNATGVNVYCDETPTAGIIDILIDGIDKGTIDCYSASYNLSQLVYSNLNLSSGSHTIEILVTGNKNSASNDCYCYFENLEIVSKTNLLTMLYDTQTFSETIPANTITTRGALKWKVSFWNSSNNGECITSSEIVFTNMSTPTINLTVPNPITSKQYNFSATYTQAENIPIKNYNFQLYAKNYIVDCGYVGDNVNGYQVNGQYVGNSGTTGVHINCGYV